jgi:hypothetical protein
VVRVLVDSAFTARVDFAWEPSHIIIEAMPVTATAAAAVLVSGLRAIILLIALLFGW